MTLHVPLTLGGPVLAWELLRGSRRFWPRILFLSYAVWLTFLFIGYLPAQNPDLTEPSRRTEWPTAEQVAFRITQYRQRMASAFVATFFAQQLAWLGLVIPAVTAGAIGLEKERDTLQALFGTELSDWQIVTGKLLGRLTILTWLAALGVPMAVAMAEIAGLPVARVLLGFLQAGVLAFALSALCILCSIWTKQTRDAILTFYSVIVLSYLGGSVLFATMPLPDWLNPWYVAEGMVDPNRSLDRLWPVAAHLTFYLLLGAACVGMATWTLRYASLRQLVDRPSRWLWAFRAPVGDKPVYWRERHVIGLAPLPVLRMVPGSLAKLGVVGFALVLVYVALDNAIGQSFIHAINTFQFTSAYRMLLNRDAERCVGEVVIMGIVILVLGPLVMLVRCAGAIAEEKRRKTWDDLLITPLDMEEILAGKLWGVLRAGTEYLVLYAVPYLVFSQLGNVPGVVIAVVFVIVTWFAMLTAATIGMGYSNLAGQGK